MKKSLKLVAVIVAFMLIQLTAAEAWTLTLRARVDYWLKVYREIRVVCERWAKKTAGSRRARRHGRDNAGHDALGPRL